MLICAALLTGFWLLATLTWPFGWDQGIFAWAGSVIREGGLPYRDAVDLKGPLPYYVYAAAQALFGHNTWGIRIVDGVAMVGAAVALRSIVMRLSTPLAGVWSGLALVMWIGSLGFWNTAQPDGWVALLMTASVAVLCMRTSRRDTARLVVAAVLAGSTALVKPFYLGFALLPLAWSWLPSSVLAAQPQHRDVQSRTTASALVLIAAAAPAAVAVGWFAAHGALEAALDVHIRFSAQSLPGLHGIDIIPRMRGMADLVMRNPVLLFALPGTIAGVVSAWRVDRRLTAVLVLWIVLAAGFVLIQNRFYRYHLLPAFPPLVALTAIGFAAVLNADHAAGFGSDRRIVNAVRVFAIVSALLVLARLAARPAHDTLRAVRYVAGSLSEDSYYRGFASLASFDAADELAMAQALRTRSHVDDRVAIIGWNAGILYLADRRSASRFGLSYPFTHDSTTALARRFQDEYIEAIELRPPEWVVVGALDGGRQTLERRLSSHPRLAAIVHALYCTDAEIGHYVLFRYCADMEHDGQGVSRADNSVAMPRNDMKPATSVTVVSRIDEDWAGS